MTTVTERLRKFITAESVVMGEGHIEVYLGTSFDYPDLHIEFAVNIELLAESALSILTAKFGNLTNIGIKHIGFSITDKLLPATLDPSVAEHLQFSYGAKELDDLTLTSSYNPVITETLKVRLDALVDNATDEIFLAVMNGVSEFCMPVSSVIAETVVDILLETHSDDFKIEAPTPE